MPSLTLEDQVLLHISTSKRESLLSYSGGGQTRHPLPYNEMMKRVVSDRLALAGMHLRTGDLMLDAGQYRTSISRHYYAIYHAGRAVAFFDFSGDDHERHAELPNHIPSGISGSGEWSRRLNEARLTRNMADYDLYPVQSAAWHEDASNISIQASRFIAECQNFFESNQEVES